MENDILVNKPLVDLQQGYSASEGYPEGWIHCKIHLNPETGEMHSDGDHRVRRWIEERIRKDHIKKRIEDELSEKEIHLLNKKCEDGLSTINGDCSPITISVRQLSVLLRGIKK